MIQGHVRDHLPRVTLSLPSQDDPVSIEFIVDTGFDGDISLPSTLLRQLDATFSSERIIRLADGSMHRRPYYEITLEWGDEMRDIEVTVLENNPLLGAALLDGYLLEVEMTSGGTVQISQL